MVKVRAQSILACSLLIAGGLYTAGVSAETLEMEGSASADSLGYDASGRPTRGTTQASVEARYGAPQRADEAVGEPPISKWHYEKFVVYFEYDRVIHAVLKR